MSEQANDIIYDKRTHVVLVQENLGLPWASWECRLSVPYLMALHHSPQSAGQSKTRVQMVDVLILVEVLDQLLPEEAGSSL